MSAGEPRPPLQPRQPAGTSGDGLDSYPTYHDTPGNTLAGAPSTRPTDANLPQSRRTAWGPIFIGVVAVGVVVLIYVVWSLFNMAETTGEAMTPGDPASPVATQAGGTPAAPGSSLDSAEAPGTGEPGLDRNVEPQNASPAPGGITAAPGAVDVPGGATSEQPPQ